MITITWSISTLIYLVIYIFIGIVTFVILRTKLNFHSRGEAKADAYLSFFWFISIPTILVVRIILHFLTKKETKQPEYNTPPPPPGFRTKQTIKTFKFGR